MRSGFLTHAGDRRYYLPIAVTHIYMHVAMVLSDELLVKETILFIPLENLSLIHI